MVKNLAIDDAEIGPDRVVMKMLVGVRHVQQGQGDAGRTLVTVGAWHTAPRAR